MQKTIQLQVHERIKQHVCQLFDHSLRDILLELAQNSRRSQATCIHLNTRQVVSQWYLDVTDDGCGVADPEVLLQIGNTGWQETIQEAEHPAGMGFFSLASRGCTVRSKDWEVAISPAVFSGNDVAHVTTCETFQQGTTISFPITDAEECRELCNQKLEDVSLYHPLPIFINGTALQRENFLQRAVRIETWQGLRIGVVRCSYANYCNSSVINFYGLVAQASLPWIKSCKAVEFYKVIVDVVDCPALQLVLPARKQVVQNQFWNELIQACWCVLYRHIATLPSHSLPYRLWKQAKDLGIVLSEAVPMLTRYQPRRMDGNDWELDGEDLSSYVDVVASGLLVKLPDIGHAENAGRYDHRIYEILFWRALNNKLCNQFFVGRQTSEYQGYKWYDSLPSLTSFECWITIDGKTIPSHAYESTDHVIVRVDKILVKARIRSASGEEEISVKTDLWINHCRDDDYSISSANIFLTHQPKITPDELTELLEAGFFCNDTDDSYDTALCDFRDDAREAAVTALSSHEEALCDRVKNLIERHLAWLLHGRSAIIAIDDGCAKVVLVPKPSS